MAGEISTKGRRLRRRERELPEEAAWEIVEATPHAVLSTCDTAGNPYGVPISPVLHNGVLYFHSTGWPGGRKADNMAANPNVTVCFIGKSTTLPEWYSVDFASAIVTGKARQVTDQAEFAEAFDAFLERHAPGNSEARNAVQKKVRMPLAVIWAVDIESISGKARAASKWEKGKSLGEVQQVEPQKWLVGVPF